VVASEVEIDATQQSSDELAGQLGVGNVIDGPILSILKTLASIVKV
jgi:hypothetical protein